MYRKGVMVKDEIKSMISVAICDDEKMMRSQIVSCLSDRELSITEFQSGKELLESKEEFDMIFLDIEMPEMDGMTVADELRARGNDSHIIFLTSHIECMPDAFKVRAFRFLSKPIDNEAFDEAFIRAEREIQDAQVVIIQKKGILFQVKLKDIVYLEAFGDGTYIYDCFGKFYESSEPLKEWEKKLDNDCFYKIHKSFLVSLYYVKDIQNNQLKLEHMKRELAISRRNVTGFKEAHLRFIKNNARVL